jgi:hypothetical protein
MVQTPDETQLMNLLVDLLFLLAGGILLVAVAHLIKRPKASLTADDLRAQTGRRLVTADEVTEINNQ